MWGCRRVIMGDRAVTVFKQGSNRAKTEYSPGVYVHWNGGGVPAWLREAAPTLRKGDMMYAAARFCGYCHTKVEGNLGLGLTAPPEQKDGVVDWAEYSLGDCGVFVVDVDSGKVTNHDGYVKPFKIEMGVF